MEETARLTLGVAGLLVLGAVVRNFLVVAPVDRDSVSSCAKGQRS